ncbi:MAG: mycothiol system anti-sigma-R factor [Bifidobacteriaceae bacterium]|jgi:anti-sigma factor (TIGR02949 family)|nr:mycothiol system anti-sigma-R factor [Bifidobacteriaceae bacterium]
MNPIAHASDPMPEGPVDCKEAMSHLYRYIDHEMTLDELERMKVHLEKCSECHYEMISAQDLRRLLRRSCIERAPNELRKRVAAKIAELREEVTATASS